MFRAGFILASALLSLAGPLSAQAPDTVGAVGGDTTVVDDSVTTPSVGQERTDEAIRAELRAIFERVPAMAEIDVAVGAGVVRLSGDVADRNAAERAAELARSRDGVVCVDDAGLTSLSAEARLEDVGGRLGEQLGDLLQLLPLLAVAVGIVVFAGFLAWLVGRGGSRQLFPKLNPFLASMLRRFVQFGIVIVGLIVALELLDATA
ncbi:MAG: BON domain-containing protein, partial [Gemmatimonadota bacterium]